MITVENLRKVLLNPGIEVTWCGTTTGEDVLVRVQSGKNSSICAVDISDALKVESDYDILLNGDVEDNKNIISISPPSQDFFGILRDASVVGVNIQAPCSPGSSRAYTRIDSCTCGYDIEVNLSESEIGGFPLPRVPILSIALWCSCGYRKFVTSIGTDLTSSQIVTETIKAIEEHSPLWLVGWNCYGFDNTCMLYHCEDDYMDLFKQVKTGPSGTVSYGYILNLPGIYNIDVYTFLSRAQASRYDAMSLRCVAETLGTSEKTEMPTMSGEVNVDDLRKYNMNDSKVTVEVWQKSGAELEIPSLALCSSSPIYDCARYVTGAMMSCMLASEAASRRCAFDWTKCTKEQLYKGGHVMDPTRGVHSGVVVCDFSSMYPSIIMGGNISPQSLKVLHPDPEHEVGSVWWDDLFTYVALTDSVASFSRSTKTLHRDIMASMIQTRARVRKLQPSYGLALKICANSMYGAIGYENSPIYSPSCSDSTTTIGRWCLNKAKSVFEENGMRVVYGDTDSCFVTGTSVTELCFSSDVQLHTKHCLEKLRIEFSSTPLSTMSMELESYHPRVILLDKKRYCKDNTNGKITFTGVSAARRDTIGLCRDTCKLVSEIILRSNDIQQSYNTIALFIDSVLRCAIGGVLQPEAVSKVARRDGKKCFIYRNSKGEESHVPIDENIVIRDGIDYAYVLKAFKEEILRFTLPCGLGDIRNICNKSTEFPL